MTEVISPAVLHGRVVAPASKSYLQRAIAIASLCEEECRISGYTPSADVDAALAIVRQLGASVSISDTTIVISMGEITKNEVILSCGESGLSARLFSAIAATHEKKITVTGKGSLTHRPFQLVKDALVQLGKTVELNNGKLPMTLWGKMHSAEITIDGSESSQLLTGLLIALPMLHGNSIVHVHHLRSVPYIQMTLDILSHYGISINHTDFQRFEIEGNQYPKAPEYIVEGDWSAASFLLVGGAIAGRVTVSGLNPNSAQADRAILEALQLAGANIAWKNDEVTSSKNLLRAFDFDATHCPDLFPPLAALAACCEGTSILKGTERLHHKESDRATTISATLQNLGIDVSIKNQTMHITGGAIRAASLSSFNDHRIAMMAAVLGCVADGPISITESKAVDKSYPNFFRDIASLRQ
jgi:3-phosphoshikimate 1-carboxyvinyltransferase